MSAAGKGRLYAVAGWLVPTAPEPIRAEVERRQLARIQDHVPMLYGIASLNVVILMAVCAHHGVAPRNWLWLSVFILLAVVRSVVWKRRQRTVLKPGAVTEVLRRSSWFASITLLGMGAFTSVTYVTGTFQHSTLIPISLAFGSMSIAHCFATTRPSAVAALGLGIVPSAVALLWAGDFDARILAICMLSVVALMVRFVAGQFDLLVTEVELQREVHDLANTDALTNLPNRRCAVGAIEAELAKGPDHRFGLALLDLDGFKGINDRLGHLAGDALLRVVAQRLEQSRATTDTAARLGGDEFLLLFRSIADVTEVHARATRMLEALCQRALVGGQTVDVRASLGASMFPVDGQTTAALLAAADEALYATKRDRAQATESADALGSEDRRRRQRA